MTSSRIPPLTFDEKAAAEAAFLGLPSDPNWPMSAHVIYSGIQAQIQRRKYLEEAVLAEAV